LQTLGVGTILLFAGFGDGVGYALVTLTGLRSPWIFLLPVLVIPLAAYLVSRGASAIRGSDRWLILAFGVFSALVVLEQFLFVRDFYLAGLVQLLVFVLVAILVCAVFAAAPAWLASAFRRAVPPIHYFLCGYVVFTFLAWHLTRWDPSIHTLLTDATARLTYYGFRPSGFGVEPAWSAFALAASYSGVHYLTPHHRLNAFLALLIAAEALQSATAYAFVGAVLLLFVFSKIRSSRIRSLGTARVAALTAAIILTAAVVIAASLSDGLSLTRARNLLLDGAVLLQTAPAQLVLVIALLLHQFREHLALRRSASDLALTGVLLTVGLAVASLGVAQPDRGAAASPVVTQSPSIGVTPSTSPSLAGSASPRVTQSPSGAFTQSPPAAGSPRPSFLPTRTPVTASPTPAVAQAPLDRVNNIVTGRDPSAGLRMRSAAVAWDLIQRSFPGGVGYGNFRQYAEYPADLEAFIEVVDEVGRYKSDFFILNYVAELGVLGVIIVLCCGALLIQTKHALAIGFFALIAGLSGTLLLPPVLAMAAVVGLLIREQHNEAATLNP
jgi:hypothetical protein